MDIFDPRDFMFEEQVDASRLAEGIAWVQENVPPCIDRLCGAKALATLEVTKCLGQQWNSYTTALFDEPTDGIAAFRYLVNSHTVASDRRCKAFIAFANPDDAMMFKLRFG